MDQLKPNHLFKAAQSGDIKKLREQLAAGVPVNSLDNERYTPLMRAAQAGQAEAFQILLQSGADLHAVGMDQVDVLEAAAEGGNIELVSFLLQQGLPIEGHWQPRSDVARRTGHMTPLICAAVEGHVEVVRLLLNAGADREAKFDKASALKHTKDMADLAKLDNNQEAQQKYKAVIALLKETSVPKPTGEDPAAREIANFAANAQRPDYSRIRKLLETRCGPSRPWQPLPDHGSPAADVFRFTLSDCQHQKELTGLQDEAAKAGFHLVLSEPWVAGEPAQFVLFPTSDKAAVVMATGTEGANYSVHTADVLAFLSNLEQDNPFILRYCGHDLVGGDFLKSPKAVKKLAARIAEFCPCCLDEGFETDEELALALKKSKSFLLRWD